MKTESWAESLVFGSESGEYRLGSPIGVDRKKQHQCLILDLQAVLFVEPNERIARGVYTPGLVSLDINEFGFGNFFSYCGFDGVDFIA